MWNCERVSDVGSHVEQDVLPEIEAIDATESESESAELVHLRNRAGEHLASLSLRGELAFNDNGFEVSGHLAERDEKDLSFFEESETWKFSVVTENSTETDKGEERKAKSEKQLNELLYSLPRVESKISTEEEKAYRNVKDFARTWKKAAKNPFTAKLRGENVNFLSEEEAVNLLAKFGVIEPDETEEGKSILKNSVPTDDLDIGKDLRISSKHSDVRYDIYPTTQAGYKGYILRAFRRGVM